MSTLTITHVFYSASKNVAVDAIHPVTGLGLYSGNAQQLIEVEYGPLQRLPTEEAVALIEKGNLTNPALITEDEFNRAYGCLPPLNSGSAMGVRIFQLIELYCGRVTHTFAKLQDGRCFTWRDIAEAPRAQLAEKVLSIA